MESSQTSPVNSNTTIKKYYAVKTSHSASPNWKHDKDTWIMNDPSANQLDTLLMDLKTERDISRDRDVFESSRKNNYRTLEREIVTRDSKHAYSPTRSYNNEESFVDYSSLENDSYGQVKSSTLYDDTFNDISSKKRQIFNGQKEPSHISHVSQSNYELDKNIYDRNNINELSVSSVHSIENSTRPRAASPYILSDDLKNLPLSEDILPVPGTKVTTTVRTYTYEVPSETINVNNTLKRDVFVKDVSTVNTRNDNIYQSGKLVQKPVDNENYTYEGTTINRSRNDTIYNSGKFAPKPTDNESYVYEGTKTINTNSHVPTINKKLTYTTKTSHVVDQDEPIHLDGTTTNHYVTKRHVMVPVPNNETTNTYYFNEETRSRPYTPQYQHGPISPDGYSVESANTTTRKTELPNNKPTLVSYEFTSTKNTVDNRGGGDYYRPKPLPESNPKHLNELLNTFPNGNQNTVTDGYHPKHEVETSVAKEYKFNTLSSDQQRVPSKNLAGPPVYYPPNHEMTLRREESSSGYRAGGGWAKAKGKYEYEAESKSKSKSSSGGAVVPVCLPLCCAMPCSIM